MKSSFKITNNFNSVLARTKTAASESLIETAAETVEEIKRNVPRKTGELAESYGFQVINENEIELGSPLERALITEFGGYNRAASPAVIPAVANAGKTISDKLTDKMK